MKPAIVRSVGISLFCLLFIVPPFFVSSLAAGSPDEINDKGRQLARAGKCSDAIGEF